MSEKRALQVAVAVAGLVPVTAGGAGVFDPRLLNFLDAPQTLSHAAYLSGLLLGIGIGFWSLIPSIEKQGRVFALLTAIVALGGLARLGIAVRFHVWTLPVILPLAMELVVTPALWFWQRRVSRL